MLQLPIVFAFLDFNSFIRAAPIPLEPPVTTHILSNGLKLILALAYSSREEMINCCKLIAQKVINKEVSINNIDGKILDYKASNVLGNISRFLNTPGGKQYMHNNN